MRRIEKLQRDIEIARKKLDQAIGDGSDEALCYELSVELDRLIERYITLEENTETSVV